MHVRILVPSGMCCSENASDACEQRVQDAGELDNVAGAAFKEGEAGFLAGIIAGRVSVSKKLHVVAGIENPPVKRYAEGCEIAVKPSLSLRFHAADLPTSRPRASACLTSRCHADSKQVLRACVRRARSA
eukprot:1834570-Rhodomonas_salina.4